DSKQRMVLLGQKFRLAKGGIVAPLFADRGCPGGVLSGTTIGSPGPRLTLTRIWEHARPTHCSRQERVLLQRLDYLYFCSDVKRILSISCSTESAVVETSESYALSVTGLA